MFKVLGKLSYLFLFFNKKNVVVSHKVGFNIEGHSVKGSKHVSVEADF